MVVFASEETCMFSGDGTHEAPSAPWTCLLGVAPRAPGADGNANGCDDQVRHNAVLWLVHSS